MERHRIRFVYTGNEDDHFVQLAFSKKMVDQRKDWLTNSMEERKRRRELGLPEMYLYETNTRHVSYKDFVNKELILFSNMDNDRSIPSMVDGLKPGQRKVLYTCFKRNDKREVKVAQLAGSVGEHSAYHHGEVSLMSTIINLAQNFVGSNNINLLLPIGQFGTRLQGGKDAASPRYIFTMLSPLARKLFSQLDDPLLNFLYDDNLKIEPEYYVPIIPTVLVNGSEGIGTGWSTKIPNYNPREIVENIRRMIRGEEPKTMKPWFKGFRGTVEQIDTQRFVVSGEAAILSGKSFEISELPIRTWTQTYKESVLETFLNGSEKVPPFISDYKEYHTDTTIRFVVNMSEENLRKSMDGGLHKTFKIQSSFSTTSMVLFDANGCLKKYETPEDILRDFFPVRLEHYVKRKAYYEGILDAEALKLENQARFILEKNDRTLLMENVRRKEFIAQLIKRNYASDPVKLWKKKNAEKDEYDSTVDSEDEDEGGKKYDFDYLIDMSMRSMLREKVEELTKLRDQKKSELERLRRSTPADLWEDDLKTFLEELNTVEQQERDEAKNGSVKLTKTVKTGSRAIKSAKSSLDDEAKPSADGERIIPKIDSDLLKKSIQSVKKTAEKASTPSETVSERDGEVKQNRDKNSSDSDNGYVPLDQRIGKSPELIDKKKKILTKTNSEETDKPKTTAPKKAAPKKRAPKGKETNGEAKKVATSKGKGKKKGRNPWSDLESDASKSDEEPELDFESSEDEVMPVPKPKAAPAKAKAAPAKNGTSSSNGESSKNGDAAPSTASVPPRNFDSDDDLFGSTKAPEEKVKTSEELFDSIFTPTGPASSNGKSSQDVDMTFDSLADSFSEASDRASNPPTPKPKATSKPKKKAKKMSSDEDMSDFDAADFKPKAAKKVSKPKKKKKFSDSEEESKSQKKVTTHNHYKCLLTTFLI